MLTVTHELTPIYVKIDEIPTTKTRQAFIRSFLNNKAFTTYTSEWCHDVQCRPGANRSVSDIHRIVLSRFPKTSFDAILRIVGTLINESKACRLTYCTDINKVVIMYSGPAEGSYASPYGVRDSGDRKGVDGYTLNGLLEEITKLN